MKLNFKLSIIALVLAINFFSCTEKKNIVEEECDCDEDNNIVENCECNEGGYVVRNCECEEEVYVWPEGPKYYYGFDEKIFLYEVENKIVITYDENYRSEILCCLQKYPQILHIRYTHGYYSELTTTEDTNEKALMDDLKMQAGVKSVNPLYCTPVEESGWFYGCTEMITTDEILVKFKENVSQQVIEKIYKEYCLEMKDVNELYHLLSVPIEFDPLEVANAIQENGLTRFSYPSFISPIVTNY